MGEYSYELYVRWGKKRGIRDCTISCTGPDDTDDLVSHFKSLPGILSISVSRLENDSVWSPDKE